MRVALKKQFLDRLSSIVCYHRVLDFIYLGIPNRISDMTRALAQLPEFLAAAQQCLSLEDSFTLYHIHNLYNTLFVWDEPVLVSVVCDLDKRLAIIPFANLAYDGRSHFCDDALNTGFVQDESLFFSEFDSVFFISKPLVSPALLLLLVQ